MTGPEGDAASLAGRLRASLAGAPVRLPELADCSECDATLARTADGRWVGAVTASTDCPASPSTGHIPADPLDLTSRPSVRDAAVQRSVITCAADLGDPLAGLFPGMGEDTARRLLDEADQAGGDPHPTLGVFIAEHTDPVTRAWVGGQRWQVVAHGDGTYRAVLLATDGDVPDSRPAQAHPAAPRHSTMRDFAGLPRAAEAAFDYPMTAACARCGAPAGKAAAGLAWRHLDRQAPRVRSQDLTPGQLAKVAAENDPILRAALESGLGVRTCAWCQTVAPTAAMELINAGPSTACRDTTACQRRMLGLPDEPARVWVVLTFPDNESLVAARFTGAKVTTGPAPGGGEQIPVAGVLREVAGLPTIPPRQ